MNLRTTAILLGVLAVAAVFFIIDRNRSQNPTTAPPTAGDVRSVIALDDGDTLAHIEIRAANGAAIELDKQTRGWRMKRPIDTAADDSAANELVRQLSNLKTRGVIVPAADLDKVGLKTPRFVIQTKTTAGKTTNIAIGNRSGLGDDLYVRIDGGAMGDSVSGDALGDRLEKNIVDMASGLRSKKLVTLTPESVRQVAVFNGAGDGPIVLNEIDGVWKIIAPRAMAADATEVDELLRKATGAEAREFVKPGSIDPKFSGLAKPLTTVAMSTRAPSTQPTTQPAGFAGESGVSKLRFGVYADAHQQTAYASSATSDEVAKIDADAMKYFLGLKAMDLRDRTVAKVPADTVQRISIVTDMPATTQPAAAAKHREIVVQRTAARPTDNNATTVPATNAPATTPPATTTLVATTPAATEPTTSAAATTETSAGPASAPAATWTLSGDASGPANDEAIEALLAAFDPLRATKYLETTGPTTQPAAAYILTLSTGIEGSRSAAKRVFFFTDEGDAKPIICESGGLRFEVSRDVVDQLKADLSKPPHRPAPPMEMPGAPPMGE